MKPDACVFSAMINGKWICRATMTECDKSEICAESEDEEQNVEDRKN